MKFCPLCDSRMSKTTVNGVITFQCVCQHTIVGGAADSLMSEQQTSSESDVKYEQLILNSPYDAAGLKVAINCKCGLDFMSMVRYGAQEKIVYVCSCGHRQNQA